MALCSASALPFFKNRPGYCGALYYDRPSGECSVSISAIPPEIRTILVEDNPTLLELVLRQEVFTKKIIRIIVLRADVESTRLLAQFAVQYYDILHHYTNTWISRNDALNLADAVLRANLHKKDRPLRGMEIGSWLGCTSYISANAMRMISSDAILYCVDTWQYSADSVDQSPFPARVDPSPFQLARGFDLFQAFLQNSAVFKFDSVIRPMRMRSDEAFEIMGREQLDFVFVDGNHAHCQAYPDILNSILRIVDGGILIGHDCECYADQVNEVHMEQNKDHDFTKLSPTQGYHYGVIKSLRDIFGKQYWIYPESSIWCKFIEKSDKIKAESLLHDWKEKWQSPGSFERELQYVSGS